MSAKESQEEEIEVLRSIYEGDSCFKEVNSTTFQYKIGEDGHNRSFIIEVSWGENYPEELPNINLDVFYNKHIIRDVKSSVTTKLAEEGEAFIGCAMTYTLFEYAKENAEDLMQDQPETPVIQTTDRETSSILPTDIDDSSKKKEKKEQLTKAQKRRMFDKFGHQSERPRGFDWVDVIKHLSQTGGIQDNS